MTILIEQTSYSCQIHLPPYFGEGIICLNLRPTYIFFYERQMFANLRKIERNVLDTCLRDSLYVKLGWT